MTRLQLKNEILNDLKRTDMTDAASAAISSAISIYEAEKWWFLETTADITTSASLATYALPSGFLHPDSFVVTISGLKDPLTSKSFHAINEKDSGLYTGQPDEYCLYDEKIRFYPIPDATYTATLAFHARLTTTSDSASNAWTNVAKNLIRYSALKEIYAAKLLDEKHASVAGSLEMNEYSRLRGLHLLQTTTGKLRKTEW